MKIMNILYILIVMTVIGNINVSAESITENGITKDGITVKLLNNTDFCDTECFSRYLVCDSKERINDLNFKFETEKKIERDLIKYVNYDVEEDKDGCRIVEITGFKNKFENIDNIPCFGDVCFNEFAWWNSSYLFRWRIFTTAKTLNMIFNVNDTYDPNYWTNNKSIMYKYCKNENCNESIIIGNKTHELNWENGTSGTGYNPELVFDSYFKGVYHIDGEGTIARDSTSNDEDGIMLIANRYENGVFGRALQYTVTGDTGNITIPFNSSGSYTFNQNLTVCAWINFTDYNTVGGKTIVSKANNGAWATEEWTFTIAGFQTPKGELDCNYKKSGVNARYQKKVAQVLTNNQIHHVCCVIDQLGEIYIYLDGSLQTPSSVSGSKASTWDNKTEPIRIGAEGRGGGGTTGFIDDVYILNAVMGSDWVSDLYNNGINNLASHGVIEYFNSSYVTFDVKDIDGIDIANFNILCDNNYTAIGVSSLYEDNLTYDTYDCSFSKSGFITEFIIFIIDDSFHFINVTMRALRGLDIIISFNMDNSQYIATCINNDTLFREWNKTSCLEGECNNLYEFEYLRCPYGCIEDYGQYGDNCNYPTWELYIMFIIVIVIIIIFGVYISTKNR